MSERKSDGQEKEHAKYKLFTERRRSEACILIFKANDYINSDLYAIGHAVDEGLFCCRQGRRLNQQQREALLRSKRRRHTPSGASSEALDARKIESDLAAASAGLLAALKGPFQGVIRAVQIVRTLTCSGLALLSGIVFALMHSLPGLVLI
jgi:hypothetical protein